MHRACQPYPTQFLQLVLPRALAAYNSITATCSGTAIVGKCPAPSESSALVAVGTSKGSQEEHCAQLGCCIQCCCKRLHVRPCGWPNQPSRAVAATRVQHSRFACSPYP
jgi:hypothetical protein